jgi:thiamine-phosphate pyrophosphorylase
MANDQRPTTGSPLLCYITDRTAFAADEATRRRHVLDKISEAALAGVHYIQLREKDLSSRGLEALAREAVGLLAQLRSSDPLLKARLLINSRTDVALATGADGVHLRSDDISADAVRAIWDQRNSSRGSSTLRTPIIGVSCHSPEEVMQAETTGADFAVFAPVFEKKDAPHAQPAGLQRLREACQAKIPVLALGGVTLENARSCLECGAAGIAGIRLFQENDISEVVRKLRSLW